MMTMMMSRGLSCPSMALKIIEVLSELGSSSKVTRKSTKVRTAVMVRTLTKIITGLSCSLLLIRQSRRLSTPLLGPPVAAPSAFLPLCLIKQVTFLETYTILLL